MIEPLYQTRATGDVLLHMAKTLGGRFNELPMERFQGGLALRHQRSLRMLENGDTFGLQFDQAWTRLLEKGGWWAPSYKTFEEFWKLLQEKGGWWDPIYDFQEWDRIFRPPPRNLSSMPSD